MTIGTVSSVAPPGRSVLAISFIARSGLKICSKTSPRNDKIQLSVAKRLVLQIFDNYLARQLCFLTMGPRLFAPLEYERRL